MRKVFFWMLVLGLTLSLCGATGEGIPDGAAVVRCAEQDFSALCDAPCATLYEADNGLYVYLGEYGEIPYVLIHRSAPLADPGDFLQSKAHPHMVSRYGDDLLDWEFIGPCTLGDHETTAMAWAYRFNGRPVDMLRALENRGDCCVSFIAKAYSDDEASGMLVRSALNALVASFQPDAGYYDGAAGTGGDAPLPHSETGIDVIEPAASAPVNAPEPFAFALTDAVENETAYARCVAPRGYRVTSGITTCTHAQSVKFPCQVHISAIREGGPELNYLSANDYMSGVSDDYSQDGMFNADFQTPLLHYMDAADYCDYFIYGIAAERGGRDIELLGEDRFSELDDFFRQKERDELKSAQAQTGWTLLTVNRISISLCRRDYAFTALGRAYRASVCLGSHGNWFTAGDYAPIQWVNWGTPFTYWMICPAQDWAEGCAAFEMFVGNTTASDQFNKANEDMSDALWVEILKAHDITGCSTFALRQMRDAIDEGSDYDVERVTDYIFDENDYTLSDGRHVKVSTRYDYVYEGDGGTVYFSDSAFAQPGGSTQLYPNS